MSHLLDMYRYNWSMIFIHLILILQLVLAIVYFKKHPQISICIFVYFAMTFIFLFIPFSFSYDNRFGRFMFQILHIVNTGVLTLAIFGWRNQQKKEITMSNEEVTPGEFTAAQIPVDSTIRIGDGLIWSLTGLWIVSVIVGVVSMIAMLSNEMEVVIGVGVVSLPIVIAMAVLGAIMLYRAWKSIQDGHARTTPGKAVGFCFIPFFNLYWIFVGFAGLAKDMNAFARRYNLVGVELPESLFTTQCILILLNIIIKYIPVIGHIYGIAISVIGLYILWQIRGAVNAINQQAAKATVLAQNA